MEVTDFYETHPINEEKILAALRSRGTPLDRLRPEDLFELDQDHYGGLDAVEVLARRGRIGADSTVLDVCSGLGGPARYLASKLGCRVTGIDITPSCVQSTTRLTELVGLTHLVGFVAGDATELPFPERSFAACIGQEAFVHIADKPRLLAGCRRVLVPGGRIAFTDWVSTPELAAEERARLAEVIAASGIETRDRYRSLLEAAGFAEIEDEDLSPLWAEILRDRLEMYRGLEETTVARFGREHHERYVENYEFFVALIENGKLGGARFGATAS